MPFMSKSNSNQKLGQQGEKYAMEYLCSRGYEILFRNWRIDHLEIDIIAKKKGAIVFIEVKTRNSDLSTVEDLISTNKERSLRRAVNSFMSDIEVDMNCQIDLILLKKKDASFDLTHLQNAIVLS